MTVWICEFPGRVVKRSNVAVWTTTTTTSTHCPVGEPGNSQPPAEKHESWRGINYPAFATGKENDKPNGYPLPGPVRINCELGTNLTTIF